MPVNKGKSSRSALGGNPLAQSIFSKTEVETQPLTEVENNQESTNNNQESLNNNQESRFLIKSEREAVNLRLPLELNDWLNDLLKKGKRQHGAKIPKEVWVQAALELFRAMPVSWSEIDSEESLREILKNLESRIKNQE
ncbi:hypothetical protein [Nostoc parmelioides]|uniref:Uncharacterized protein n=1 Tax=Nostoc parmelioides FACHB-3921 TaxID=2692909 RepID=A0ABR8BKS0_9NOSO|nr:hypothetical protein [Nostoc parmelioides]MBD2254683.1 hypothetical protein [Nostoc parmelioides FACHB-3921]